jgi:hypothetical protein
MVHETIDGSLISNLAISLDLNPACRFLLSWNYMQSFSIDVWCNLCNLLSIFLDPWLICEEFVTHQDASCHGALSSFSTSHESHLVVSRDAVMVK